MRKIFVILMFSIAFTQNTKTLTLKSGDKITGQVVEETETTITVINSLMGQMTINKSDLKQETIKLTTKDGDVVQGLVIEKTETYFKLETAFGEVTIPTTEIQNIGDAIKPKEGGLKAKRTIFGTRWEKEYTENDEWYFSKERLMDVWFDPTGYTIEKNRFYLSGLSWGFGLTDRIHITSRWTNYFWQDFNIRPKWNFFKSGNLESQSAMAVGIHFHTRGLPGKYVYVNDKDTYWDYEYGEGDNGDWGRIDSTYITQPGWVRLGSKRELQEDDYGDEERYEYTDFTDGNEPWFDIFGAYTLSKMRAGGNGRFNTTLGASATLYPGEDIAPRIFAAIDIDVTRNIKVLGEIFYDEYYPELLDREDGVKMRSPVHFDFGFLTNKLGLDDNFWIGLHFQQPFITFYWKF